mmetsp:Transcript_6935/g.27940  ORF Transcript_6935/g.27940 Transcript_6935/m.27940 type:complete len:203 (+) Transcript_6935:808-1416(+)
MMMNSTKMSFHRSKKQTRSRSRSRSRRQLLPQRLSSLFALRSSPQPWALLPPSRSSSFFSPQSLRLVSRVSSSFASVPEREHPSLLASRSTRRTRSSPCAAVEAETLEGVTTLRKACTRARATRLRHSRSHRRRPHRLHSRAPATPRLSRASPPAYEPLAQPCPRRRRAARARARARVRLHLRDRHRFRRPNPVFSPRSRAS